MDEIREVGDQQDIEMSFNAGRITIKGVREEVDRARDAIHELLRKFQKERWLDEEAKLVADKVQWSVVVCVNLCFSHSPSPSSSQPQIFRNFISLLDTKVPNVISTIYTHVLVMRVIASLRFPST